MSKLCAFLFLCLLFAPCLSTAQDAQGNAGSAPEKNWGMAFGFRSGSIVFASNDSVSTSFVPMLYYQGERFYLDGLEGGVHLFEQERVQFSLLGRVRFFDAPKSLQNRLQGDALDWGGQLRYRLNSRSWIDAEILTDPVGRLHGNLRYSGLIDRGSFEFVPYVNLRLKSADFNTRYYALDWDGYPPIDGGVDLQVGGRLRYHVLSNLYLLASAELGLLEGEVRDAQAVDSSVAASAFAGFGFFNDRKAERSAPSGLRPWLRLAQGFATPSSIGNILTGTIEEDLHHNQLTSLFFGIPLTDRVFTLPLEVYLTPGYAYHHASSVQEAGSEFILALKIYYRLAWAVQMRIGLGTGFSWVSKTSYQERSNNESKGYLPSDLLHYLDFSADLNLGDLVRNDQLRRTWLGVGVHHRSAIFETAQQYGRIKGGSNYPMVYVQIDF